MGRKPLNRSLTEKRQQKNETRRRHQSQMRRSQAISDYLLLAATEMHRQASLFVDGLIQKYPDKNDVRKTPEFKEWQRNQLTLVTNQPKTHAVPDAEEDLTNMANQIPGNIIKDIVSEIQNDPELSAIINDFNIEVLDQGAVPTGSHDGVDRHVYPPATGSDDGVDRHVYPPESMHDNEMDLNIELDDRLGDELNKLM